MTGMNRRNLLFIVVLLGNVATTDCKGLGKVSELLLKICFLCSLSKPTYLSVPSSNTLAEKQVLHVAAALSFAFQHYSLVCGRYGNVAAACLEILFSSSLPAGEGPCLATYFVRHYWQLLVLRVLTGISVGGTLPLIYSLVGDLFDVKKRAPVAAAIQVSTGIGLAAGQAISGFVGETATLNNCTLTTRDS